MRAFVISGIACCLLTPLLFAQSTNASRDHRIKPEQLGFPAGNIRSSEPFAVRIYKTDEYGDILPKQPKGYPKSLEADYELKDQETPRVHEGIDFTSRATGEKSSRPLEFKAGVYGVVVKAGDGQFGTISVQIHDGSILQYLHGSASYVKVGDPVAPDFKLGLTGSKGAGAVHLHLQARDPKGNIINPDLAFLAGQTKGVSKLKPEPESLDLDLAMEHIVKPTIHKKTVSAKVEPEIDYYAEVPATETKAKVELGKYSSWSAAAAAAIRWSEAHPDDLRLWRVREVVLKK